MCICRLCILVNTYIHVWYILYYSVHNTVFSKLVLSFCSYHRQLGTSRGVHDVYIFLSVDIYFDLCFTIYKHYKAYFDSYQAVHEEVVPSLLWLAMKERNHLHWVKVAVTSLKLEIRLHAHQVGTNARSGTEAICTLIWLAHHSKLGYFACGLILGLSDNTATLGYCISCYFREGFIFANFARQTLAKISTSIHVYL